MSYATASSMANVVNRLLQEDLFESFDMPLDVTPQQIAAEIVDYCENSDVSNGHYSKSKVVQIIVF